MVGLILGKPRVVGPSLVALTLCSALTSEEGGLSPLAIVAIFAFAALKAEIVLDNFMEAPRAQPHWQWLYRLWIGAVTIVLTAGFVL